MILQFSTLSVRVMALMWLLAVVQSYKYVVFILVFLPRVLMLYFWDPKSKRRSLYRNVLWSFCYCLITAVWDKDDRYPIASRRGFLYLNILDTLESFVFIAYAGFISQVSDLLVSSLLFNILSDSIRGWNFIMDYLL